RRKTIGDVKFSQFQEIGFSCRIALDLAFIIPERLVTRRKYRSVGQKRTVGLFYNRIGIDKGLPVKGGRIGVGSGSVLPWDYFGVQPTAQPAIELRPNAQTFIL